MRFEAAIFDLDGVITDTARLHYQSWKWVFDDFLRRYGDMKGEVYPPFTYQDYLLHVDGKPRYEGVRDFLAARGIVLDMEERSDAAEGFSVHGLGERKNQLFHELLQQEGIETFPDALAFIQQLHHKSIKLAVVSSSKNCPAVLQAAGLNQHFSVQVDGNTLSQYGLPGKPAPHLFRLAAEELAVAPADCLVIEDAGVGIKAAQKGGFGLVVGVDRDETKAHLLVASGADRVVNLLTELSLDWIKDWLANTLPSALSEFVELEPRFQSQAISVFLDYDGTLTPVVERPEQADLSPEVRFSIAEAARRFPIAIISGRSLADVREKVALDALYYVGNHGFEISDPQGIPLATPVTIDYLMDIEACYQQLVTKLGAIPDILIEHKRYSLAVHYRLISDEEQIKTIKTTIDTLMTQYKRLTKREGKKVFEVRPNIEWHKGKAVEMLVTKMSKSGLPQCPIYIGDDVTDEDAFRVVQSMGGVSILVSHTPRPTSAQYMLKTCDEVRRFLNKLIRYGHAHPADSSLEVALPRV